MGGDSNLPEQSDPIQQPDSSGQKSDANLKSTATVGGFTMLSRVLGLIRDVVIANFVGASASTDAFATRNGRRLPRRGLSQRRPAAGLDAQPRD